jgi:hypothetical protein
VGTKLKVKSKTMTRIANDNPIDQDGDVKDNIILPFQLQESGLRGRAIRLGSELNTIISAHFTFIGRYDHSRRGVIIHVEI